MVALLLLPIAIADYDCLPSHHYPLQLPTFPQLHFVIFVLLAITPITMIALRNHLQNIKNTTLIWPCHFKA